MNKRELVNQLINDLAKNAPMTDVMLKAQALSFELYNAQFSNWVRKEQRGYENDSEIPKYREFACVIRADIFIPFQGIVNNFAIPVDVIKDENVRTLLSHVKLTQSLMEIEQLSRYEGKGELRSNLPGALFPEIQNILNNGHVQNAYRVFSVTSLVAVINTIKSKLLDFFSFLNRNIDLDKNFNDEEIQMTIDKLFTMYILE